MLTHEEIRAAFASFDKLHPKHPKKITLEDKVDTILQELQELKSMLQSKEVGDY